MQLEYMVVKCSYSVTFRMRHVLGASAMQRTQLSVRFGSSVVAEAVFPPRKAVSSDFGC
jgi:hypothetical protein